MSQFRQQSEMIGAGDRYSLATHNVEMQEKAVVDSQQAVHAEPGYPWPGRAWFAVAGGFHCTVCITFSQSPVYGPGW